jgi:hypothetical protein
MIAPLVRLSPVLGPLAINQKVASLAVESKAQLAPMLCMRKTSLSFEAHSDKCTAAVEPFAVRPTAAIRGQAD